MKVKKLQEILQSLDSESEIDFYAILPESESYKIISKYHEKVLEAFHKRSPYLGLIQIDSLPSGALSIYDLEVEPINSEKS